MNFFDHPVILVIVGIISIPVYYELAKAFFGDKFENLWETIKFLITPDFISLLKGRFLDDYYATLKFNIFVFMCFGWAAAVTELLARYIL